MAGIFVHGTRIENESRWKPQADVFRTPSGWVIKMDLAGVRPEDIQITLGSSRITISGMRRDWIVEEGWYFHSMEIAYTRFERTFDLPSQVENAEIKTECRQGMLLIRLTTGSSGHE